MDFWSSWPGKQSLCCSEQVKVPVFQAPLSKNSHCAAGRWGRDAWAQVQFVREGKREQNWGIPQVFKWYNMSSLLTHLASPVCISSWFTHDLYTSTGLVLIMRDLSSMISFTTGARSWRRVFCPRAPRLKLTTILMTVGFPVTISCIWSTLELYQEQKSSQIWLMYAVIHVFKTHTF